MDKYKKRRLALKALIDSMGRGGIATVAAQIGKEPSYVSRMLYPTGKAGGKRIGEDTLDILTSKYPNWFCEIEKNIASDCLPEFSDTEYPENGIDDIRRENMVTLRDAHGGTTSFAKLLERSESQVSQWTLGSTHYATGKQRGMRSESARYIEKKCGKPVGWLDRDHSQEADIKPASPQVSLIASPLASNTANEIAQAYDKADEVTQLLVKALLLEQGLSTPWVDNFVGMAVMGIKATADKWLKDQSKADQTRSA